MAQGFQQDGIQGALVGPPPIQPLAQQYLNPASTQIAPVHQYSPQPYQQSLQPGLHQLTQQSIHQSVQQRIQEPLQQIGPTVTAAVQAPLQQLAVPPPQPDPQHFVQTIHHPLPVTQPQIVEMVRQMSFPTAAQTGTPSDPTVNAMYGRFVGGSITKPMIARLIPIDDAQVVQPLASARSLPSPPPPSPVDTRKTSSCAGKVAVVGPTPQPKVEMQTGAGQNTVGLSLENEILLKDRQKKKRKKRRTKKIIVETSSSDSEPPQPLTSPLPPPPTQPLVVPDAAPVKDAK